GVQLRGAPPPAGAGQAAADGRRARAAARGRAHTRRDARRPPGPGPDRAAGPGHVHPGRRHEPAHLVSSGGIRVSSPPETADPVEGALPDRVIDVTPTFVIASALATRDFQDVHHDRDRAVVRGARDIFINILTTTGLVQRYVSA